MPDSLPILSVVPLGDSALLLQFGDSIEEAVSERVIAAGEWLVSRELPGVLDVVPAYTTLAVFYDPAVWTHAALTKQLFAMPAASSRVGSGRLVEIPVCYASAFAPDMDAVCAHTGLASDEVVRRHLEPIYRVYFLGFVPGFAYLGGLDPAISMPRKATPRIAIPAGSVAIGGSQTGVYPSQTPGGWQIIGRTPVALFQPHRSPPSLLQAGDELRFVPITRQEFLDFAASAQSRA